ncbi:porin family protein [Hymenobacter sp. GOD-10R]|uniref:porin family protein n=1 Tax=Hymenobacter sp. GOD-10R TaxID=3093922 RepID=UPI002D79DDB4|nr:porin family protein [Hymenobacter sp. GOD-10R]WRQ28149.1 porin family protein [Hymenobacter sp. GOD-10R]
MKKAFLAVVALLLITSASAIESRAQGVRVGIKAGANLSNLSGDLQDEDRFQNKTGFVGGLMLNVPLLADNFLSLQPELLYSQKGFKNDGSYLKGLYSYKGKATYNYLDLPVLAKIKAGPIFVEAGPQFSYLINRKDETRRYLNGQQLDYSSAERDLSNVNRFEVGYAAGIGVQVVGVILDVRYNGSFTDFTKNGYQGNDLRNARNSVFQASVGFLFPSGN